LGLYEINTINDAITEVAVRCSGSAMMFEIIEVIKEILLDKNEVPVSAHDTMLREQELEDSKRELTEEELELLKSDTNTEITEGVFLVW
jgi:hypothetical protein